MKVTAQLDFALIKRLERRARDLDAPIAAILRMAIGAAVGMTNREVAAVNAKMAKRHETLRSQAIANGAVPRRPARREGTGVSVRVPRTWATLLRRHTGMDWERARGDHRPHVAQAIEAGMDALGI